MPPSPLPCHTRQQRLKGNQHQCGYERDTKHAEGKADRKLIETDAHSQAEDAPAGCGCGPRDLRCLPLPFCIVILIALPAFLPPQPRAQATEEHTGKIAAPGAEGIAEWQAEEEPDGWHESLGGSKGECQAYPRARRQWRNAYDRRERKRIQPQGQHEED